MENATKAMLIAAGVLIGIMIVSLGVVLFSSLQRYVDSSQESIRFAELKKFNEQYTKYVNYSGEGNKTDFDLTMQDIVTAASLAYENNKYYGATEVETGDDDASLYVAVYLDDNQIEYNIHEYSAQYLTNELTEPYTKKYKCTVEYSNLTGRVKKVKFVSYNEEE